jgi:EAL domain-containing protein (putative c-di-GMP-specific phosphodiesterase class I)
VSVRQIEGREDFVQKVAALLEETRLDPRLLDLEITEGVLLKDEDAAIALFEKLRDMGVGLSLDDFGTGYSSLSYLRRLPIDTLKIDRSFIHGAHSNPEDAALVGSIIAMAKVLDLRVVAEGVETRRQRRLLEELGCDEIQGFLFSSPLDASATAALLLKQPRPQRKTATHAVSS